MVFFTNMPTDASMVPNSVTFKTQYDNGKVVGHDSRLDQLAGGISTDMNHIIDKFNLPTTIEKHVAGSKISGCLLYTSIYKDITLQLGEVYNLNVEMSESSELLNEVIVTAAKTK